LTCNTLDPYHRNTNLIECGTERQVIAVVQW
jgi:hypothetical protein